MHCRRLSFQYGADTSNTVLIFVLSKTENRGLAARAGYSAPSIGSTRQDNPASRMISAANSYHEHEPSPE